MVTEQCSECQQHPFQLASIFEGRGHADDGGTRRILTQPSYKHKVLKCVI
jgi:hypothetical protein